MASQRQNVQKLDVQPLDSKALFSKGSTVVFDAAYLGWNFWTGALSARRRLQPGAPMLGAIYLAGGTHRFTQDALRMALGLNPADDYYLEKSKEPLPKLVQLAFLAWSTARLTHADGYRFPTHKRFAYVWAEREYPGRKEL